LAAVAAMGEAEERLGLLAAAKAGDRAAFELLMRRYERMVLITALRLLGNLSDAQDAGQEVFLRLYRGLAHVNSQNLAGWLYRVTVNVCHDMRRRTPATSPEVAAVAVENPERQLLETERRDVLRRSLRLLSEREREAFVLRDLEGLSTAEVAWAMGTTEATVRSHIWKARIKVREFVERYFRRR
jgi:RNA polymerase sigma-70 factor (ECF subfamily)